jgi:aryl-alcohol dehydrogenase-like predicted oxidoreductase
MLIITRRRFNAMAGGLLAAPVVRAAGPEGALITRAVPRSGERLPAVGLGTASVFDRDDASTNAAAAAVLGTMLGGGASLVDTSSVYGDAETVLGSAMAANNWRARFFVATKLEQPDATELARSQKRLRTQKIDLLQLHNVNDPGQSLGRFVEWKAQGVCRYVGITSTYHGDFAAVEAVLKREKPDFVQIDYSLDNRLAEERILPLAAEVKAGVLTALPFGRGRLFRAVKDKPVPDWAQDFAQSWAVFFLKYLLGDERVTAVIPGTSNPRHMAENLGAMRGRLPTPDERKRMVALLGNS